MRLKIRRLDSTVSLPAYGTDESAGFDLAAAHDVDVPPRQIALVRTGLVIEVPIRSLPGHFRPQQHPAETRTDGGERRRRHRPGLLGPDDEVMIQVLNITDAPSRGAPRRPPGPGHRPAAPRVTWQEVSEIREVTRGGFGATGN